VLLSILTRRNFVKLITAALCLAALSITGCATNDDANEGGYSAVRPSKPSLDTSSTAQHPDFDRLQKIGMIDTSDNLRASGFQGAVVMSDGEWPLPNNVCDGCEVTLVTVDQDKVEDPGIGEIDVMSDGGNRLCKIYLNGDGSLDTTNCQR
jgi:hypothetical protein